MRYLIIVLAVVVFFACYPIPRASLWEGSEDSTLSLYIIKGEHSAQFVIYPYFQNASTIKKLDSLLSGHNKMILEWHPAKNK
jgi:hypothetical protein